MCSRNLIIKYNVIWLAVRDSNRFVCLYTLLINVFRQSTAAHGNHFGLGRAQHMVVSVIQLFTDFRFRQQHIYYDSRVNIASRNVFSFALVGLRCVENRRKWNEATTQIPLVSTIAICTNSSKWKWATSEFNGKFNRKKRCFSQRKNNISFTLFGREWDAIGQCRCRRSNYCAQNDDKTI